MDIRYYLNRTHWDDLEAEGEQPTLRSVAEQLGIDLKSSPNLHTRKNGNKVTDLDTPISEGDRVEFDNAVIKKNAQEDPLAFPPEF